MERKEVFVADKVFSLGLKELDQAINGGEPRTMTLEVGPRVFQAGVLRPDRAFCLHWMATTNIRNVIWQRFVVLHFRWPPVQAMSCFSNVKGDI